MSLKSFLNRALKREATESNAPADSSSTWEQMMNEAKPVAPAQGLARFINVHTPSPDPPRGTRTSEDELKKRDGAKRATEAPERGNRTTSASPWERLAEGTNGGDPPQAQGLARFIDVRTPGEDLLRQARALEEDLRKRAGMEAGRDGFLIKHRDLVERFLEIAERKVSILDDYGDENWDALPEEIHKCLVRIAKREPSIDVSKISPKSPFLTIKKLPGGYNEPTARYMAATLDSRFRVYHDARKKMPSASQDISALGGIDFETYIAKLLTEFGFESVVGTPASGDQGADLIARRSGRTIAIQAKGYRGSVGNGAVQEIVGALRFYKADEGWVVTNSTFTASARALAQANNIRLIDGNDLKDLAALKARL